MITRDTFRNQWVGLSSDNWATTNPVLAPLNNGDSRFDMDTSTAYMWDAQNNQWRELN